MQHGLDVGVTFIGEGEAEHTLRRQAQELGLHDRVTFLGFRPPVELVHYYRTCDVAVLPSLDEGLGLTLVEAMFCGVPVVGTDTGGISSLISNGESGLLVPPGDAGALAQAIERILTDPTYARRLAAAGRAYVRRHYDTDTLVQQVLDAYQHAKEAHA
jgi:glycosyltransferase involved in cell wall biosynthesis